MFIASALFFARRAMGGGPLHILAGVLLALSGAALMFAADKRGTKHE